MKLITIELLKYCLEPEIIFEDYDPGDAVAEAKWWNKNRRLEGNFTFNEDHVVIWAFIYDSEENSIEENLAIEDSYYFEYSEALTAEWLINKVKDIARRRVVNMLINIMS